MSSLVLVHGRGEEGAVALCSVMVRVTRNLCRAFPWVIEDVRGGSLCHSGGVMNKALMIMVDFSILVQIAKVEKLKPLEVELRRLEDLSESIVNDFAYMKKREEEMRDTNGETLFILFFLSPAFLAHPALLRSPLCSFYQLPAHYPPQILLSWHPLAPS